LILIRGQNMALIESLRTTAADSYSALAGAPLGRFGQFPRHVPLVLPAKTQNGFLNWADQVLNPAQTAPALDEPLLRTVV